MGHIHSLVLTRERIARLNLHLHENPDLSNNVIDHISFIGLQPSTRQMHSEHFIEKSSSGNL